MRLSAAVQSPSPVAAERPQWLYLGSKETSMCLLRRISSVVGRGANQSCGMVFVVGDVSVSPEVGENASMESPVVVGWTLVSAINKVRSGAICEKNVTSIAFDVLDDSKPIVEGVSTNTFRWLEEFS